MGLAASNTCSYALASQLNIALLFKTRTFKINGGTSKLYHLHLHFNVVCTPTNASLAKLLQNISHFSHNKSYYKKQTKIRLSLQLKTGWAQRTLAILWA